MRVKLIVNIGKNKTGSVIEVIDWIGKILVRDNQATQLDSQKSIDNPPKDKMIRRYKKK